VGADQLALAIGAAGAAGAEALVAAARIVGDRLTRAAARIGAAPRAGALGPARAAIVRSRVTLGDPALIVIGARARARHAGAPARRQLAARRPRPLGLGVADALGADARAPVELAPSWGAGAAPPEVAARASAGASSSGVGMSSSSGMSSRSGSGARPAW